MPGAVNATGAAPQSGSYTFFGGSLDVSAAAANTAQPAVSADLTSGGCTTSCAGGSYGVTSQIFYHIEVTGPAGVFVPYNFDTAGGVTLIGPFGGGSAQVNLIAPGGAGLTGFNASTILSNGNVFCGSSGCVNGTQHVNLLSNTEYTVEVYATAGAGTNSAAIVSAWADPYIYIDPTFVGGDQFLLHISDGIGNTPLSAVPEPSTWAMMILGFAGLGFMAYHQEIKASIVGRLIDDH